MADYSSDDIWYVLRPDAELRSGAVSAPDITREHLKAEGKKIPELGWGFALGGAASLGLVLLSVQLLMGSIPSMAHFFVVGAPWLVAYHFLGGELAYFKVPIKGWITGLATLSALIVIAICYIYVRDIFEVLAPLFTLFMGLTGLIVYSLALLDSPFRKATENVRCVLTKAPKTQRGKELRDQFSTLLFAGTFEAVLRSSNTPEEAIEKQTGQMSHLNSAGLEEARRLFTAQAAGAST